MTELDESDKKRRSMVNRPPNVPESLNRQKLIGIQHLRNGIDCFVGDVKVTAVQSGRSTTVHVRVPGGEALPVVSSEMSPCSRIVPKVRKRQRSSQADTRDNLEFSRTQKCFPDGPLGGQGLAVPPPEFQVH